MYSRLRPQSSKEGLMALNIVGKACQFSSDLSKATITIESDLPGPPFTDGIYELEQVGARNLAIAYAGQVGMGVAHLNGNTSSVYPVNSDGVPLHEVRGPAGEPLPPQHPKMQPARYRIDVPVTKPIR
jgi:hypothetical protein